VKKYEKMAIKSVHLETDAYMVCLTHALSTEREEVMGLLIGEVRNKIMWGTSRLT